MRHIKIFILVLIVLTIVSAGCNKKQEPDPQQNTTTQPPKEQFADKEKELKDKEELLRIREENVAKREQEVKLREEQMMGISSTTDTSKKNLTVTDTTKTKSKDKKDIKKTNKEKEKQLNQKLDSPTTAVKDYLEYIKRGVTDKKKQDANFKKASQQWETNQDGRYTTIKKNYKNSTKFSLVNNPVVVVQDGKKATVKVKIQISDKGKKGETSKEVEVTYNLVADKNGKWLIKNNTIK